MRFRCPDLSRQFPILDVQPENRGIHFRPHGLKTRDRFARALPGEMQATQRFS
jgi:hypothetical protein